MWTEDSNLPTDATTVHPQGNGCNLSFITFTIGGATLAAIGIVGNGLTLVVLKRDGLCSATYFLLKCLAMSDIGILMSWTFFDISLGMFYLDNQAGHYSEVFSYISVIVIPVCRFTETISVWFIVAVTWQRYLAVCWPTKAGTWGSLRHARIISVTILVVPSQNALNTPWKEMLLAKSAEVRLL